jgi:hypothetical protein
MPHVIKRIFSRISPKTRLAALTLLAAMAVGIAIAWVVANTTGRASSEQPNPHVADFSQSPLTPPFGGTPFALTPALYPPPPSEGCEDATRTESPGPGLPLLPKHNCIQEPKQGVIPSALATERVDPKGVPEGWRVVDNQMFRFTLAVPPDWYVNMLPDGGAFEIINPAALTLLARPDRGEAERAGVEIAFIAYKYRPGGQDPTSKALANPNATFNGIPGAIWDELPVSEPTILRMIRAAFVRYDYVFSGNALFGEGYSESDVAAVQKIFASITPY